MPKVVWAGDDEDALTADEIDEAEDGFQAYTGEVPPGGVYRFKIKRIKFKTSSKDTKGLSARMELDGSWKPGHAKYNGAQLWDDIWMTKGSAAFVKAFAQAIGVTGADLIGKVVIDDDGYVTKIGRKVIEGKELIVYVAVKRETYEGTERITKAGTGFQIVEDEADADEDNEEAVEAAKPAKKTAAKAAPAKTKAKAGKNKATADDEEPPF